MAEFKLDLYVGKGEKLLNRTRSIIEKYHDVCKNINLPDSMHTGDESIKLVFVGQYSAGKSSIIKMLSGIDTGIGAGIKTQEASTYLWNGLEIVDTPGIHTELCPDHDEKTYYQINHAALLIFVVTNEGFDNRMGAHFRKLAIEQKRAKNMVLVVNKMDRTALGNVPEQQEVIAKDLEKVIEPYKPNDLYLSFLDTESYFEWQNETDEELRGIYYEQSGYDAFINNLNKFVESRGILAQLQGPLETLKSAVTHAIGIEKYSCDDDGNLEEELFRRKMQALMDGKRRVLMEIEELADTCAQKIKMEGTKAANAIEPGVDEATVKRRLENAQTQAELYISSCESSMLNRFSEICDDINKELIKIDHSSLANRLNSNINEKSLELHSMENRVPSKDMDLISGLKKNQLLDMAIVGVGMNAKGAAQLAANVPLLGEVNAAGAVKNIGHFFGHSFKPWGAVNLVKGAANILGWIGIAVTAYQILSKVFGDDKEREMYENLHKAQDQVRDEFDRGAEEVRDEIIMIANSKVEELTSPALLETSGQMKLHERNIERAGQMRTELEGVLREIDDLMDDVQRAVKE